MKWTAARWTAALPEPARLLLVRSRIDLGRVARLTGAAAASYVVALVLLDTQLPILAPLTALLVVQVTLVGIVRSGIDRMLAVVAGVLVATAFSSAVGVTWWSLALLIAASLVVGQLIRLGDNLLEVPISAMIVLGAGAVEATAQDRVVETLIGAAVGIGVNVVVPPRVRVVDAAGAVEDLAVAMGELLDRTAREVRTGLTPEQAERLVEGTARVGDQVARVDRVLLEAEESRRLNPRAIGTATDSGPRLRSGLDVLEHTVVALRGLSRSIADEVTGRAAADTTGDGDGDHGDGDARGHTAGDTETDDELSDEARAALAELLGELSQALRAFGRLVRAEVDEEAGATDPHADELSHLLEALREARVRLTELLLVDPRTPGSSWELNGAILTSVERVLRELDTEERARLRRRLEEAAPRSSTAAVVDRLRSATVQTTRQVTRQVTEVPRRQVRKVRRARRQRRDDEALELP